MKIFNILFFIISSYAFANEFIEVSLKTEKALPPMALFFRREAASYEKLENVIQNDLDQTGFTEVLLTEPYKDKGFDRAFWKTIGCAYVARGTFLRDVFFLEILDVKQGALKAFHEIALSRNLDEDRRKIHTYVAEIGKSLFHVRGIQDRRILYSLRLKKKGALDWTSEIWICDYDGENRKQLISDDTYCISPRFIPGEDGFIYVGYVKGQPKIFKADFHSQKKIPLIGLRGSQALPSISPDAHAIAFISDAAGRPDLFIQTAESIKPKQLFSYPRATQATSSFSPDGRKIAFVSDKDGPPRIYTLEVPKESTFKTPKVTLITKQNRQNTSPAWSPDGTKIAYSAKTDGVRQIWLYDFAKKEEKQLTFGNKNYENPMWAPNSLHLIFNSEDDFISDLYMMNIKQTHPTKISIGAGDKKFPAFEY